MKTMVGIFMGLLLWPALVAGQSTDTLNQTDRQGERHGLWIKKYSNGQVQYRGHFNHGEPVGTFKRFYPNGNRKAVMQHDRSRGVYAQLFDRKGKKRAEGLYVDRKKDSTWRFYSRNGQLVLSESYRQGQRHGASIKYYPNGDTAQVTNWQKGRKAGPYKQFFPSGRPKMIAQYKNGELHGPFTIFFPNGLKEIEGTYQNDLRHGKWVYFSKKADTSRVLNYRNGEPLNEEALELKESQRLQELENNKGKFGDPRQMLRPNRGRRRPRP